MSLKHEGQPAIETPKTPKELFIKVLAWPDIPKEFYDQVLVPARCRNFRKAMGMSPRQMEELERNVQRKDNVGFGHDTLQFHKLLASSDHYMLVFNLEKNVLWEKLSEKDVLDMMDLYVLHLKTVSIDKEDWKRTTVKSGESLVKTPVKSEVIPMNMPVKSEVSIPKTPVKNKGSVRA